MSVFTGVDYEPDTMAIIRDRYLTPAYFEYRIRGAEYTHRGAEVIYILGWEDGLVKVGQSVDFATRLKAHCSSPRTRGNTLTHGWRLWSDNRLQDEATLKRLASELGGISIGHTSEWFTGIDVHVLIDAAERELHLESWLSSLPTERAN